MIQLKNITFLLFLGFSWAQFETPVTLSVVEKEPVRAGEVATIIVNAEMDDEWRIYALRNQGKGPVASNLMGSRLTRLMRGSPPRSSFFSSITFDVTSETMYSAISFIK